MDLPIDLLRTFAHVCELRSFTRAGAVLQRSQPAISLQMKRLEGMVGATLFRREAGGVDLTAAGVTLIAYARRMLELNDELMEQFERRQAGTVRLGMPNDYAAALLPRVLEGFKAENEDVDLEIHCGISVDLIDLLRQDKLDIVLAMTDGAGPDESVKSWAERLVWVARPDIDPDHGERLSLIAYPHGCVYRQRMLGALSRADRQARIAYSTGSLESIVAGVRAGLGMTVMSEHTVPAGLATHDGDNGLPALPASKIGLFRGPSAMTGATQKLMDRFVGEIDAARQRANAA